MAHLSSSSAPDRSPPALSPESQSSAAVKARRQALMLLGAREFGWKLPAGEGYDSTVFDADPYLATRLESARAAWHASEGKGPWPRAALQEKIFGDARDRVTRPIAPIMQVADAMVNEYLLTYGWECRAWAGMLRGDAQATQQSYLAEAVRAQCSAYYTNALLEQGYSMEETDKVIRSVNGGFMKFLETRFSMEEGFARPGISPRREKDMLPATSIRNIQLYADQVWQRRGNESMLEALANPQNEFEENKREALAKVAAAFGFKAPKHGQCDPAMLPPLSFYDRMYQEWNPNFDGLNVTRDIILVSSPKVGVESRLFAHELIRGQVNDKRLAIDHPDEQEAIGGLVHAMLDQYLQCMFWEHRNHVLKERDSGVSPAMYEARKDAIEAVKSQIAPYYCSVLQKQGLSESVSKKVIGEAIRGFADTLRRTGEYSEFGVVNPQPDCTNPRTPGEVIRDTQHHARVAMQRVRTPGTN